MYGKVKINRKQAGAALCKAQQSAQLKLATTSSKLATQLPGLLTQPAVAGAGSLDELQQRIDWHLGMK